MRNFFSAIVNWVAGLFGAYGGTPHPIVATDAVRVEPRRRSRGRKR